MSWWPRTPNFLSSSPSSSSSSPNSPKSHLRQHQYESRRLTRARKLRHLQDSDIGGVRISPAVAEPEALSKSSSIDHFSSTRSSFAVPQPQPLPVPDLSGLLRRDGYATSKNSSPVDFPLPSPKEDRDGTTATTSEGASLNGWIGSRIGDQDAVKGSDHVETRSMRKVSHDRNGVESARENFRLNVPFRSAPTSPYSSPLLSPQRMRGDLFLSHYIPPQGLQVWSEPEMPISNTYLGFPSHISPEKIMLSPDSTPLHGSSPLYSPTLRSPRHNARSASQPASPLHQKLSIEYSTVLRESNGNANVHPLPLPPGASMPSQPAPIPQVVAKPELLSMTRQWQKGKLIGRGTFGSVYMATNLETGALCAMKEVELCPDDPKSVECMKQLEQEIKVLSHLQHPNIVQYYGSEIVEDKFCIYLEYVHPGSINKYVNEHCGAITESVVRNFTRHILCGLAYLHSTKTIHRDIKGANLLVDASGVVKLADFGMAKHLTTQAANLSMKGSPYWMAPELMQAVMQKDTRSDSALAVDIWSLGCTIIEMLNGKPPWSEYEGAAAMFKVMRESPPIPESLSLEGKDFLRCCFRRNPAERPSASMLLAHPFLKNSPQLDVKSFPHGFNAMKLQDRVNRERSSYDLDQLPIIPGMQARRGKLASNSETGQRSHHETSDSTLTLTSHQSPRSTLEALPSPSPPHSGIRTHHPSPSANGWCYQSWL